MRDYLDCKPLLRRVIQSLLVTFFSASPVVFRSAILKWFLLWVIVTRIENYSFFNI